VFKPHRRPKAFTAGATKDSSISSKLDQNDEGMGYWIDAHSVVVVGPG
tara:strand:+ start:944 stop:1087 length:144 start_codon:yes stop_codon:yes gene_type:complete